MNRRGKSLQLVVLLPVLALNMVAGGVLYMLVLWTVGDYADESIRSNLNSLARSAFAIADVQEDRRNREGKSRLLYQMYARVRFEDFAREHDIGLIIEDGGAVASERLDKTVVDAITQETPAAGHSLVRVPGGREYYIQTRFFEPWNWRLILVKDASAFKAVVGEVRAIYIGSAVMLLLVTLGLVIWLRQVLVRPILRIARDFLDGREPNYEGVSELEELSGSIGAMKRDLEARTLHLNTALDSMSDAITVFDPEMRLVAWNPQFVRLYHYPDDFIREGLAFEDIMRFNAERGDYGDVDIEAQTRRLVERGRKMNPPSWEVDREDGTSIEIRRARMPDGGYVTTYTDITDRKQAEAAEIGRREAEAANVFKSKFLENMSHDLRKPVTSVIEAAGLVAEMDTKSLPRKQRRNVESIHVNANHLLGLIDEILEISRIEAGQVEISPEPVSLGALAEGALHAVRPIAESKGLTLSARVDRNLQAVTDPRLLSRILVNLAGNAVQYTDAGTVTVSAHRNDDDLVIAIADTGPGIPAQKLDDIFEKFQGIKPVAGIVKPGMGLGLGLTISKEFAHMLDGEITVESKVGEGSVFTVTMPVIGPAGGEGARFEQEAEL